MNIAPRVNPTDTRANVGVCRSAGKIVTRIIIKPIKPIKKSEIKAKTNLSLFIKLPFFYNHYSGSIYPIKATNIPIKSGFISVSPSLAFESPFDNIL